MIGSKRFIYVCVCVCVCTHARMCTRSIFLPVNTWTWIYLHYRYEIQEMTQVFGSTLSLSPSFSLQIKWNLVSGNTNPNRFYLQEFWWVKTILDTYGWRYWIIIHERVGKEIDEMRFKTKPRQNPKGDQLGTWDFRDNIWDTHTHTHTPHTHTHTHTHIYKTHVYIYITHVNPCYSSNGKTSFCWEGLKKTTNALIWLSYILMQWTLKH